MERTKNVFDEKESTTPKGKKDGPEAITASSVREEEENSEHSLTQAPVGGSTIEGKDVRGSTNRVGESEPPVSGKGNLLLPSEDGKQICCFMRGGTRGTKGGRRGRIMERPDVSRCLKLPGRVFV